MRSFEAVLTELRFDAGERPVGWITCPAKAIPSPGQYVLAWSRDDYLAPLATPLFPMRVDETGFLSATPLPRSWEPGALLEIRGPLGRGFQIPTGTSRLALAAMGVTAARLLPLVDLALGANIAVALFTSMPLQRVPAAVEVYPVHEITEALAWADIVMLDIPIDDLANLHAWLHIKPGERLPCPAQVLVDTHMPCGGLAECGACTVTTRRSWKHACQDGPVFSLAELNW